MVFAKLKTVNFGGTNEWGFNVDGAGIRALDYTFGVLGRCRSLWVTTSEGISEPRDGLGPIIQTALAGIIIPRNLALA